MPFWCSSSLLRGAGSTFRQTSLFPELASKGPHVGRKKMKLNSESREEDVTYPEIRLNYLREQRDIAFTVQGKDGESSQKSKDLPRGISCPGFGRWMRLLQDSVEGKSTLALREKRRRRRNRRKTRLQVPGLRERQVSPYPQRLRCPWGGGSRSRLSA